VQGLRRGSRRGGGVAQSHYVEPLLIYWEYE